MVLCLIMPCAGSVGCLWLSRIECSILKSCLVCRRWLLRLVFIGASREGPGWLTYDGIRIIKGRALTGHHLTWREDSCIILSRPLNDVSPHAIARATQID